MYRELYNRSTTKMMILGGGCSTATEPTAQASHHWNLIQVCREIDWSPKYPGTGLTGPMSSLDQIAKKWLYFAYSYLCFNSGLHLYVYRRDTVRNHCSNINTNSVNTDTIIFHQFHRKMSNSLWTTRHKTCKHTNLLSTEKYYFYQKQVTSQH